MDYFHSNAHLKCMHKINYSQLHQRTDPESKAPLCVENRLRSRLYDAGKSLQGTQGAERKTGKKKRKRKSRYVKVMKSAQYRKVKLQHSTQYRHPQTGRQTTRRYLYWV